MLYSSKKWEKTLTYLKTEKVKTNYGSHELTKYIVHIV